MHSLNGMFGHPEAATSCGIHFLTFGVAILTVYASSDAGLSATLRDERQSLLFQVSEVHFDRKRRWSLIVFDIVLQFHIKPIHERMTTFLEPRDYAEYLDLAERPPVHLLRILPSEEMEATLVEKSDITNKQVGLFDSH